MGSKKFKAPTTSADVTFDVAEELVLTLIDHPKEFEKMPRRSVVLPGKKIIISASKNEKIKRVGDFVVVPRTFAPEKFNKETFSRLKPC